MGGASAPPNFLFFFSFILYRPYFLKSGQLITGQTGLIYKGKDGTGRIIKPDEYALKSEVEGGVGDMNNELVKYGKEKISEAITEKGVPTASTEMFDQMATNIRSINSYSGSSALNIYCQTNKPTAQNGLWVKRPSSEINDIQIKNGIYTADGTANNIKSNTEYCLCGGWSGLVGSVLYCLGGYRVRGVSGNDGPGNPVIDSSTNNYSFAYDIDTDIFTVVPYLPSKPSYEANGRRSSIGLNESNLTYNNNIYALGYIGGNSNSNSIVYMWVYDTKSAVTTRYDLRQNGYGSVGGITSAKIIGNKLYILVAHTGSSYYSIHEIDLDTNTITLLADIRDMHFIYVGPFVLNDNALEFFGQISGNTNSGLIAKIDLSTKIITKYSKDELKIIYHYTDSNANTSHRFGGNCIQIGDLLYTFGAMTSGSKTDDTLACQSVSIYNIKTKVTSGIDNVLPQRYGRSYLYYYAYYKGNVYLIGGNYHGGGSNNTDCKWYHTIAKFAINSKDLEPGTIVCDPSSYFNSTEMYNDGKTKLDFGVNQVYYQSADGFSIQPAAVIKNGVVTNIN